jgi:hypothetical protein
MTFYVYENWTHDRARLHRGECGYCNDGSGLSPKMLGVTASGMVHMTTVSWLQKLWPASSALTANCAGIASPSRRVCNL